MNNITILLLLAIGFALTFSAIGYLLYSRYTRKSAGSYYWKPGGNKTATAEIIKQEFREQDQQTKAYKTAIGYTAQCRNISNKILNEIEGLYQQRNDNHTIRIIDLQFISSLKESIIHLQSEINLYLTGKAGSGLNDIAKDVTILKDQLDVLCKSVGSLLDASSEQQNDIGFLKQLKSKTDNLYHEIVRIHEHCISEFQEYFSKI